MRIAKRFLTIICILAVMATSGAACTGEGNYGPKGASGQQEGSPPQERGSTAQTERTNPWRTNQIAQPGHASRTSPSKEQKDGTDQKHKTSIEKNSADEPVESAVKEKVKQNIKGVYVSAHALQGDKWTEIQKLLERTELNAVVIDVKNDFGKMTYPTATAGAKQIRADQDAKVNDIVPILKELKAKGIYTIARIVTFKDPFLAARKPEWAMKKADGRVMRDKHGVSWLDPYHEAVWTYTIDIAKEAVEKGFDEVQFDYVRFPVMGKTEAQEVAYYNPAGETKDQIISRFLSEAVREIHAIGGVVSADVFGLTTTAKDGMGIGQKWELIAAETDVISPMLYPSHYASGSYGVRYPDLQPYKILSEAVSDANKRNAALKKREPHVARIRPWLQDFTATWIKPHQSYNRSEVQQQIRALEDQGITQYLLWNPSCRYSL